MSLSDLFSSSVLFSILIIFIFGCCLIAYVNWKMAEQDHKLTSMLGLVSTLADELQFFRSKLVYNTESNIANIDKVQKLVVGKKDELIEVSDDESNADFDDDEESDDNEVSDDDDNDDEESDADEASDDDVSVDDASEDNNKILKLSPEEFDIQEITDLGHDLNESNIKTIHLEDNNENNNDNDNNDNNENTIDEELKEQNNMQFLKTITISDLGEDETEDINKSKIDYKKMSVDKLRKVVTEKGLNIDASKLKKNEIIPLLINID